MTNESSTSRTEKHNESATPENTRLRRRQQAAPDRLRQHRLSLGRNPVNQKTLTQIDFVKRTPRPEDFLNQEDFQEIQNVEGTDGAAGLERTPPPPPPPRSMQEIRKRNPNPNAKPKKRKSGHTVGRRSSGRGGEYNNRTLTQMVNVDMGHGTVVDNMDDGEQKPITAVGKRSAKKRSARDMESVPIKSEDKGEDEYAMEKPTPTKRARRDDGIKTEKGDDINTDSIWSRPRDHANTQVPENGASQGFLKPQTPQKQLRYVVPSSQSPESPEITFGSPHKVKDGPVPFPLIFSPEKSRAKKGSPLKHNAGEEGEEDVVESSVKLRETPSPGEDMEDSQFVVHDSFNIDHEVNEAASVPLSPLSPIRPIEGLSESFKKDMRATPPANKPERQRSEPATQKQSIIYETDCDESETESFHDAVSQPQNGDDDSDRTLVPSSQPKSDNSLRHLDSYRDHGSIDDDAACTMRSDVSLLYSRRPLSYAYEKIHDTQNFGVDDKKSRGSPGATDNAPEPNRTEPDPTKTLSIADPKIPTESEQARIEEQKQDELPSSPVIQIESSQRSEPEICASDASEPPSEEARGVLTASQLLTESLMESIPGPPAWLFNENHTQDELVDG